MKISKQNLKWAETRYKKKIMNQEQFNKMYALKGEFNYNHFIGHIKFRT